MVNFCFSDVQLRKLRRQLKKSKKAAFAAGTYQNLRLQWRSFISFCCYFKLQWLPTSAETLCLYAQLLSHSFKSVKSIQNYISGIKTLHLLTDTDCPFFGNLELKLSLRGLSRLNPHCPRQAAPITPQILVGIHGLLEHDNPVHATMWCLFLIAFFTLSRKSNLVVTGTKLKVGHQLLRSDIKQGSAGLLVTFRWTKTIQFGERVLQSPLVEIPGCVLCPLQAYRNMISLVPARRSDNAFVFPSKSKAKPVTYQFMQKFLKVVISNLGLDSSKYSSHSFRRGGATWAFKSQVPTRLIQVQGDWASQCYMRYLDLSLEQRLLVSKQMSENILV